MISLVIISLMIIFNISSAQDNVFGTLSDFVLVDDGLYMGDFRRGVPEGFGTVIYFTNDKNDRYNYTGEWVKGKRHGEGTTTFRNKRIHKGSYNRDKENGRGTIIYPNGDVFRGFFTDGLRQGHGKLELSNGDSREGDWLNDKLTGFVFFRSQFENNVPKIERWNNGKRHKDNAKERDRGGLSVSDDEEIPPYYKLLPGNYARDAQSNKIQQSFSVNQTQNNDKSDGNFRKARKQDDRILKAIFDRVN